MDTIGVGIIGASPGAASWAANTHVPALQALPDYELKAVATSRRASADAAATAYGVTGYDNAGALIAADGIDLVVVAVRVPDHARLVEQALSAGKMVYSEWPLATSLGEATDLAAQAKAAGVRTVIGLQGRYAPQVRHAHDLVAAGALGGILAASLVGSGAAWGPVTDRSHAYLYDLTNGATTLTAAAMHALEALEYVLGRPETISSTLTIGQSGVRLLEDDSAVPVSAHDQVAVQGTLPGGALLSAFYRGGVSRAENFRWAISGTDGELLLTSTTPGNGNLQAIDLQLSGAFGDDATMSDIAIPDLDPETVRRLPPGPARNVARLYDALAHDIRTGQATVPDFAHALAQHQLVDAVLEADRTGQNQRLPTAG
jgi:predicted dehydrogenase